MSTYTIGPYCYSDELYHHGILGMKWGVRRFQNKDGTRTFAGKKKQSSSVKEKLQKAKSFAKEQLYKRGEKIDKSFHGHGGVKMALETVSTAMFNYISFPMMQASLNFITGDKYAKQVKIGTEAIKTITNANWAYHVAALAVYRHEKGKNV